MIIDIRVFLLIFFTGILAFSNAFYVFDLRTEEGFQKSRGEFSIVGGEEELNYPKIAGDSYI
jgi:hypothetical protein